MRVGEVLHQMLVVLEFHLNLVLHRLALALLEQQD